MTKHGCRRVLKISRTNPVAVDRRVYYSVQCVEFIHCKGIERCHVEHARSSFSMLSRHEPRRARSAQCRIRASGCVASEHGLRHVQNRLPHFGCDFSTTSDAQCTNVARGRHWPSQSSMCFAAGGAQQLFDFRSGHSCGRAQRLGAVFGCDALRREPPFRPGCLEEVGPAR